MTAPAVLVEQVLEVLSSHPHEESAWARLYDLTWPFVFATALRALNGDHAAAEDAAQTVFLQLLRYTDFSRIRTAQELKAYLRVMTRRTAAGSGGERRDPAAADAPVAMTAESEPEATAERSDLLARALRDLEPGDRRLVKMLAAGWTRSEIARHFGISVNAATVRIHRLRQKLGEDPRWHQLRSSF